MNDPAKPVEGDEGEIQWYKQQLGRQANELGELRKTVDEYIFKQDEASAPSFDDDPVAAMERLVEKKIAPLRSEVTQTSAQTARARLAEHHPDYEQVVSDPAFQSWVQGSRVNTAAFEAAISGDIDTGIDLLNTYKGSHTQTQDALDTSLALNKGGSSDTGARDGQVYKRADIIRKKIEDPAWYRNNQEDILKAYAEGRVR